MAGTLNNEMKIRVLQLVFEKLLSNLLVCGFLDVYSIIGLTMAACRPIKLK